VALLERRAEGLTLTAPWWRRTVVQPRTRTVEVLVTADHRGERGRQRTGGAAASWGVAKQSVGRVPLTNLGLSHHLREQQRLVVDLDYATDRFPFRFRFFVVKVKLGCETDFGVVVAT
jgi:hypothetical protein